MNIKDWFKLADVDRTLLMKLVALHLIIIAASNYIVQFSGTIFGYHFTWAMFVFPLVVIATDLTVRLTNKYQARAVIAIAFVPAIFISAFIADWRIGLASAFAYLVGQLFDVTVFQKIATSLILFLPVYGILLKYLKSRLAIQTAG